MNRVVISRNLQWHKYLMLVLIIIIVLVFTKALLSPDTDPNFIYAVPIFPIICLYFAYQSHQSKRVSFDDQFMLITLRDNEETIPLKDVLKITLTMTSINDRNMWKITYLDRESQTKSVQILPKWEDGIFESFQAMVKTQNPKVTIKHTANSWSNN